MTVASELSEIEYAGNGATVAFSIPFGFSSNSDIAVATRDSSGDATPLSTGFTITGAGTGSGTCTFTTAPASGTTVRIERAPEIVQNTDYTANDAFPAEATERALDERAYVDQFLRTLIRRCIQVPAGDDAIDDSVVLPAVSSRKGKLLYFDDTTGAIDVLDLTSVSGISSPLSQGVIGSTLYPRTAAEIAAGVTPTNYYVPSHEGCGYVMPERYGTNATPGTTDMSTALDSCSAVAASAGGGTILLQNRYKRTTSWSMLAKVNIQGVGYKSGIEFSDCDGMTFGFTTSFGKLILDNFYLLGVGGTTRRAIYQAGTTSASDELYGVTLSRLLITAWNVPIKFRTVRELHILDCWAQDCNGFIELVGACLSVKILNNTAVYGSGNGSGNKLGIYLDSYAYAVGGTVAPEGVIAKYNHIYGFDTDIRATTAIFVDLNENDLQALKYGIEFSTVQGMLNVNDNYIEIAGSAAVCGVIGHGVGSALVSQVNIMRNNFVATSTTTSVGCQVNDSSNQNQDNVTIEGNLFNGFITRDIQIYAGVNCSIFENTCKSSPPTYSIHVDSVVSGTVFVDRNTCTKDIYFDPAEAASGEVRVGTNIKSTSTVSIGAQVAPTVASTASLSLPIGAEVFHISGTTSITSISATGWAGRKATLIFDGVLTLTDGSNLKLAGNYVTTADDAITLVCDGTNWYDAGRGVN